MMKHKAKNAAGEKAQGIGRRLRRWALFGRSKPAPAAKLPKIPKVVEPICIPHEPQQYPWWGFTCLAAILQYAGEPVTSADVFREVRGVMPHMEPDGLGSHFVSIGELVQAAQRLTQRPVIFGCQEKYDKLAGDHPKIEPHMILRSYLYRGMPCLVRLAGTYAVVVGYDDEQHFYWVWRPIEQGFEEMAYRLFDQRWHSADVQTDYLGYNSAYLLLAIGK